ncbi:hypothetical protein SteCoe_33649 [Stentor coeruleus]|uniref:Uncharacterized protein n=1 Tax=Stentor coeruleus TaxID=5963 RepID=A0A1R2AW99_9CILI|nr:hypothetical protein SteCoe_33649 [Stentor coeruleus]
MQLFPIDTLTEKTLQNIDSLLDSSSASLDSEHILLNWLAKAVEYASEKQKIITLRQKLIEYNTEMQEIMESISKLKKSKAKFLQNAKDINKYLDSDASYTNNSIDTTMNSKIKPSFSMSQSSPQSQSAKISFESLKIEKKTLKYSEFSEKAKEETFDIVLEDSTELGCCSYKFFCFT